MAMHEVVLEWTAADRGAEYTKQCSRFVLKRMQNGTQLDTSRNDSFALGFGRAHAVSAMHKHACCFHRCHVNLSGPYRSRRPTKHIRFIDPAVVGTNDLMGTWKNGRTLFFHVSGDKTSELLANYLLEAGYTTGVSKDQTCMFSRGLPRDTPDEVSINRWRNLADEFVSHGGFANTGSFTQQGQMEKSHSIPQMISRCDTEGVWHDSNLMPHQQVWRTWDWRWNEAGLLHDLADSL